MVPVRVYIGEIIERAIAVVRINHGKSRLLLNRFGDFFSECFLGIENG